MSKYELTNKAVEDLTGIWEYTIEKWSEQQADRYYNLLLDSCQDIADNPELGKIMTESQMTYSDLKLVDI